MSLLATSNSIAIKDADGTEVFSTEIPLLHFISKHTAHIKYRPLVAQTYRGSISDDINPTFPQAPWQKITHRAIYDTELDTWTTTSQTTAGSTWGFNPSSTMSPGYWAPETDQRYRTVLGQSAVATPGFLCAARITPVTGGYPRISAKGQQTFPNSILYFSSMFILDKDRRLVVRKEGADIVLDLIVSRYSPMNMLGWSDGSLVSGPEATTRLSLFESRTDYMSAVPQWFDLDIDVYLVSGL